MKAARLSGYIQIALGALVLMESFRRFIYGSEPEGPLMISFGLMALLANVYCLFLISKHKSGGVHMKASFIFSANDVIVNIGIITSGFLVIQLGSHIPDIIIGTIVSFIVIRGGVLILKESTAEACEN
jgi:Co/Zn/Cd efflux system component